MPLMLHFPFAHANKDEGIFIIHNQMNVINLIPHVTFFEDKTGDLTRLDILDQLDQFKPTKQTFFNRGFTQSVFWLTVVISNPSSENLPFIVHFDAPLIDYLDVYFEGDEQQFLLYRHGDQQWFKNDNNKVNQVFYAQELNLRPHSQRRLLIRVESESLTTLPISISSVKEFGGWLSKVEKFRGLYQGIIIGLILYNLMIFFSTRDHVYLNYLFFSFSFCLMHMFMDGWFNSFLWQWPYLQQRGVFYLLLSIGISGAMLATKTLRLPVLSPKLNMLISASIAFMIIILLASPLIPLQSFATLSDVTVLLGSIILTISAISCSRHGISYAKYFYIGYGMLGLISSSVIAGVLTQTMSIIMANSLSRISVLTLLILITMALSVRFKQLERKQQEAEALALEAQLKEETKSKFFANMSHEIRTPLNAVIGVSELMADTPLNSVQKNYNKIINSSGNILLTLVNNILDYSKIETGNMTIEKGEVNIRALAKEIRSVFSHLSVIKGLELIINIDDGIPGIFYGDSTRIKQILINMLGNAFKFTKQGYIELIIKASPAKDQIFFEIVDTGIGIKTEDLASLFDPFTQADTATYRQYGGTGLGLSIVKNLIEKMEGDIQVESQQGKGTRFIIQLPLEYKHSTMENPGYILPPLRVLIAEDNPEVVKIYKDNLNSLSIAYDVVITKEQLLEKLSNKNTQHAFDLILLDAQLDNDNTIDLIKSITQKTIPIPIALLSGTGIPVPLDELKGMGVTLSEAKPVSAAELQHFIANCLGLEKQAHTQKVDQDIIQPEKPLNILVAEDNPTNQLVTAGMLKKLGHQYTIVDNGEDALRQYTENPDSFDIIFMDCEMPIMDGFQATQKIRQWEQEQGIEKITIFALTAHAHDSYTDKIAQSGMDECIVKPVSIKHLNQRLNKVSPL